MFTSPILAKIVLGIIAVVFLYSTFANFTYVKLSLAIVFIFLMKLILSEEIALLIHPRYFWLTKAAAVAIFAILFLCRKDHQKVRGIHFILLTILNLALVFSIFVEFKPLSSGAQGPSNFSINVSRLSREKRLTNFRTNTNNLTLEDWLSMFSIDPEPSRYTGKKVKVNGFYYENQDGQPAIGKYIISCCVADARIMGIWLTKPLNYNEDTWLELEGTLKEIELNGQRDIAIEVISTKQISAPKDPYATK